LTLTLIDLNRIYEEAVDRREGLEKYFVVIDPDAAREAVVAVANAENAHCERNESKKKTRGRNNKITA
jgi:hypothetical protein